MSNEKAIQSIENKIFAIEKKLDEEFRELPYPQRHKSPIFIQYLQEKEQLIRQRTTIEEKELLVLKATLNSSKPNRTSSTHSHQADRPYQCIRCTSAFTRCHDLKRHERSLHSNIKPYVCKNCDKAFGRMDALKRHVNNTKSCASYKANQEWTKILPPQGHAFQFQHFNEAEECQTDNNHDEQTEELIYDDWIRQ